MPNRKRRFHSPTTGAPVNDPAHRTRSWSARTAFEFHRNSALDATNFFTNRAGQKKGHFRRNQFGGNIGGPIVKDLSLRKRRSGNDK
jgi:hypothetical protein